MGGGGGHSTPTVTPPPPTKAPKPSKLAALLGRGPGSAPLPDGKAQPGDGDGLWLYDDDYGFDIMPPPAAPENALLARFVRARRLSPATCSHGVLHAAAWMRATWKRAAWMRDSCIMQRTQESVTCVHWRSFIELHQHPADSC